MRRGGPIPGYFTKRLAVVSGEDDEQVVAEADLAQRREDAADRLVHPSHLGVVALPARSCQVGVAGGRRQMRVHIVDPDEERLVRVRLQPLDEVRLGVGERHLVLAPDDRLRLLRVDGIEALAEATARADQERVGVERRGGETAGMEQLGERGEVGMDAIRVRVGADLGRIASGVERTERRQRPRRRRRGMVEHHGLTCPGVEVRGRRPPGVAVQTEPIEAQRVDGDQHHLPRPPRCRRPPAPFRDRAGADRDQHRGCNHQNTSAHAQLSRA
jgi:hypothetical protein